MSQKALLVDDGPTVLTSLRRNIGDRFDLACANSAAEALAIVIYYDLAYLRSQVKDYGLPEFANHLIPIVEFAYSTPTSSQHAGTTTGTIAPGFLYEAGSYQIGLEALIPATRASGNATGFIAQFHVFLDDLLPHSPLGKPLF